MQTLNTSTIVSHTDIYARIIVYATLIYPLCDYEQQHQSNAFVMSWLSDVLMEKETTVQERLHTVTTVPVDSGQILFPVSIFVLLHDLALTPLTYFRSSRVLPAFQHSVYWCPRV
jgi:hypothetical protein